MPSTITLTETLKAAVLEVVISQTDEFDPEDADKVRAVPVGAVLPTDFGNERDDRLAWYPEEATGEEIIILAWDAYALPMYPERS